MRMTQNAEYAHSKPSTIDSLGVTDDDSIIAANTNHVVRRHAIGISVTYLP